MMHRIISVETNDNLIISAIFLDGTVKEYDLRQMIAIYPPMKDLENRELFHSIRVDAGGYGVSWNDELDLEAETIWEDGNEVRQCQ